MSLRAHACGDPGPYATHCTDDPGHAYSHYDASDDSSWNDGSPAGWQADVGHQCDEPDCPGLPGACRHCGRTPEEDGDHTCPCPHPDGLCPEHDRAPDDARDLA